VYLAGQVSWDTEGNLMGRDDVAAQAEQCYLNIAAALDAVGATAADLAKVTVYIVDLDEAKAEQFVIGRERAAATLGVEFQQPSTWIAGERFRVPAGARFSVEHERGDGEEEVEFQLKWKLDDATESSADGTLV
jgi:enamine deaminase RidA (YjgF/YER057c/UK114 family)